jgi:phosphatidylglycerophosphate synthase
MDHPADIAFVRAAQPAIAFMREKLRLTPNMVTGLSFLFALVSFVFLWRDNLPGFVAASLAGYLLDDLDGAMARRYRMASKLGEVLDHVSDLFYFVGVLVVLVLRHGALRHRPGWFALLALSGLLPAAQNAAANRHCGSDSGAIGIVAAVLVPADRDAAADLSAALRPFGGMSYQLALYAAVSALVLVLRRDRERRGGKR